MIASPLDLLISRPKMPTIITGRADFHDSGTMRGKKTTKHSKDEPVQDSDEENENSGTIQRMKISKHSKDEPVQNSGVENLMAETSCLFTRILVFVSKYVRCSCNSQRGSPFCFQSINFNISSTILLISSARSPRKFKLRALTGHCILLMQMMLRELIMRGFEKSEEVINSNAFQRVTEKLNTVRGHVQGPPPKILPPRRESPLFTRDADFIIRDLFPMTGTDLWPSRECNLLCLNPHCHCCRGITEAHFLQH
jgi:hypothetical protein